MNDVRQLFLAVGINVVHAEFLCQQHVDLDGNQRIFLAVDIPVLDIQFRPVECRLVDTDFVVYAQVVQNIAHHPLGFLPLLRRSFVLVIRIGRIPLGEAEGALIQQPHGAQEVFRQIQAVFEFFFQLIGSQH